MTKYKINHHSTVFGLKASIAKHVNQIINLCIVFKQVFNEIDTVNLNPYNKYIQTVRSSLLKITKN